MKKFFKSKIFLWSLASFIGITFIFFHFIGPRLIVSKRSSDKPYPDIREFNIHFESFPIISHDGLRLANFFCFSNLDTIKGTILFIHGIGSRKERFIPMAEALADNGFQSILIDLRAHGQSHGDYITYGYNETKDISDLITCADTTYNLQSIGIWGQSLGGAISLQMLAKDKRIDFGIIESTYSTFDEVIHDYSNRIVGFPLGFLNDYVIWRAQDIANFDKVNLNPEDACLQIDQPILYVHGTEDDRIDVSYGKRNYNKIVSTDKELVLVEGANHVNVWDIGGEAYKIKCLEFLNQAAGK